MAFAFVWCVVLCLDLFGRPETHSSFGSKHFIFQAINRDHGLSNANILSIAQDNNGFIWIATELGLNRFDGFEIQTFSHDPENPKSLPSQWVNSILFDQNDIGWFGTSQGLSRFNPRDGSWDRVHLDVHPPENSSINAVHVLGLDKDGYLLLFSGGTLIRMHSESYEQQTLQLTRQNRPRVTEIRNGGFFTDSLIWLKTDGHFIWVNASFELIKWMNISELSTASWQELLPPNFQPYDRPKTIFFPNENGVLIYLASKNRFEWFSSDQFQDSSDGNELKFNDVKNDRWQNTWISSTAGLFRYDPIEEKISRVSPPQNPRWENAFSKINHIFFDLADSIWLSVINDGILKGNLKTLENQGAGEGVLPFNDVRALRLEEPDELFVAGMDGLAVLQRTELGWQQNEASAWHNGLPANLGIFSFLKDRDGRYWLATYDGLYVRQNPASTWVQLPKDQIPCFDSNYDKVRTIFQDRFGTIWIGTEGSGLCYLEPNSDQWEQMKFDPEQPASLSNDYVNAFLEVGPYLWIATSRGLNRWNFNDRVLQSWTVDQGVPSPMPNDFVVTIETSSDNGLWIGCYGGGLHYLNSEGQFFSYGPKHGLPSQSIHVIERDQSGRIWIATDKGVAVKESESDFFTTLDEDDGLFGTSFHVGASFQSPEGHLFLGGNHGFDFINPNVVINSERHFGPVIQEIRVALDTENPSEISLIPPHQSGRGEKPSINLPADHKSFAIKIAALDAVRPENVNFLYRLEGIDKDWKSTAGHLSVAKYGALPSGQYTFKTRTDKIGSLNSSNITSVALSIQKPDRQDRWLFVMAFILTIFALLIVITVRKTTMTRSLVFPDGSSPAKTDHLFKNTISESDSAKVIEQVSMQSPSSDAPSRSPNENVQARTGLEAIVDHATPSSRPLYSNNKAQEEEKPPTQPYILVICEEAEHLFTLDLLLGKTFQLAVRHDGLSGLDTALKTPPQLVIADYWSPMIDGLELCHFLRKNPLTKDIPVFLMLDRNRVNPASFPSPRPWTNLFSLPVDQKELHLLVNIFFNHGRPKEVPISPWLKNVSQDGLGSMEDQFHSQIFDLLDSNYTEPTFGVYELAELAGLSRRQLHRKVTACFELTPTNLIRAYRLQQAAKLLIMRKGNVSDICYSTGFSNPTYFSRQFRQEFDRSPRDFARLG